MLLVLYRIQDIKDKAQTVRRKIEAQRTKRTLLPAGTILPYTGSTVPKGWLLCDGKHFNVHLYPNLANLLNGSTVTPDLSGRFLLGASNNYGLNTHGGAPTVTLQVGHLPPHYHTVTFENDGSVVGCNVQLGNTGNTYRFTGGPFSGSTHGDRAGGGNTGTTGSGNAFGILPPYRVVNYIIKG